MTEAQNFSDCKQRATQELLEMNKRAQQSGNTQNHQNGAASPATQNLIKSINIPSDALLVLGLVFILSNENCDKMLLLALLYILS